MDKLKTFYITFVNSISRPSYYKNILSSEYSFSVKYLAFLLFLISLVSAVKFAFIIYAVKPKLPEYAAKIKEVVTTIYPDKLVVTLKSGKISTNVKEPYNIEMPEAGKVIDLKGMHLITIDTKGKVEDYKKYNSIILLTAESAVVPDNQNGHTSYKVYPLQDYLKDVPDGSQLNKTVYQSLVANILPYIDKLPNYALNFGLLILILWPFLGALLSLSGHMFSLFFATIVLYLVAKLMKKNLGFKQVYQLGLHALTLPILISSVLLLFGKSIPFLFSIIFFVFMILVFRELPARTKS